MRGCEDARMRGCEEVGTVARAMRWVMVRSAAWELGINLHKVRNAWTKRKFARETRRVTRASVTGPPGARGSSDTMMILDGEMGNTHLKGS